MARASKYGDVWHEVLAAIAAAESGHSKSPTVRGLAQEHAVSVSTMHSYLTKLRDEGLIEWRQGRHRSIRTTPQGSQRLSQLAV